MTSLIKHLVIVMTIAIGITSCSSDPCESVTCVNGNCNEGICDCAPGFMGPACDQIIYNYVGEYRSTILSQVGCPNSSENFSVNTNSDNQVCVTIDNTTTCLEVLFRLEDDNTFFLNIITTTIQGSLRVGKPSVTRGTYTTSENEIRLCNDSNACEDMFLDMSQSTITWLQLPPSSNNCGIEWVMTRQ